MNAKRKKPSDKRTWVIVVAAITLFVIVGIAVLVTSGGGPRAPALRPEPVYKNTREGFRFVAPEGWKQVAKADLPSGPAEKERLMVRYQAATGEPAALEATVIDLSESADIAAYLSQPSYGVSEWKLIGVPETLTIHDVGATRFSFRSANLAKETVAFRRGPRLFLFTITASPTADKSRDLARKAIESTVWTK